MGGESRGVSGMSIRWYGQDVVENPLWLAYEYDDSTVSFEWDNSPAV